MACLCVCVCVCVCGGGGKGDTSQGIQNIKRELVKRVYEVNKRMQQQRSGCCKVSRVPLSLLVLVKFLVVLECLVLR